MYQFKFLPLKSFNKQKYFKKYVKNNVLYEINSEINYNILLCQFDFGELNENK